MFDWKGETDLNKKKLSTAKYPAMIPANVQSPSFPWSAASRIFPKTQNERVIHPSLTCAHWFSLTAHQQLQNWKNIKKSFDYQTQITQ